MYLSDAGAPPPSFFGTTANPDYLLNDLDTTAFPAFDTTNSIQATEMPLWEITNEPSADFPGVNFGKSFENPKPILWENDDSVRHYKTGEGRTSAGVFSQIDIINLDFDLLRKLQESFPDLKKSDPYLYGSDNNLSQCHPFPFCDENGCSGIGLSLFVAFELLLLVLIVAANLAIISVIRDMNKSTKNRQYRSNNVFKMSLAIADLCLGLSILPAGIQSSIAALIDQNFNVNYSQIASLGSAPAIIFGAGAVISTIVAIWSIFWIQIDIFLRIRWPVEQHSGALMNTKRARIIVVSTWCLAVGIVVLLWPLGFSFALQPATLTYSPILLPKVENGSLVTNSDDLYKIPLYAGMVWGVPFLLTLPLGAYLIHVIRKACAKLRMRTQASYIKRHPEQAEHRSRVKKDWEAAVRTLVIELVYVVTFLPTIIAHIIYWKHDGCDPRANIAHFIGQFILVVGSFVNLFIYHLMWKDFQTRLRALFCGQKPTQTHRRRVTDFNSGTQISTIEEGSYPVKVTSVSFDVPSKV